MEATVKADVERALKLLGYRAEGCCVQLEPEKFPHLARVKVRGKAFGVWDGRKKTFVD